MEAKQRTGKKAIMSMAWEVTREDVEAVIRMNNVNSSKFGGDENAFDEWVDKCFDNIDHDLVERSALCGNDMSEQIDYANLSIYEQLIEAGKL